MGSRYINPYRMEASTRRFPISVDDWKKTERSSKALQTNAEYCIFVSSKICGNLVGLHRAELGDLFNSYNDRAVEIE